MSQPIRKRKTCSSCSDDAGRFFQWWNRDTGFGICPRCAREQHRKLSAEEFESYYGKSGTHLTFDDLEEGGDV